VISNEETQNDWKLRDDWAKVSSHPETRLISHLDSGFMHVHFLLFFFPGSSDCWELPLSPHFLFTSSLLPSHSFFPQVLFKPFSKLKLQMRFLHPEWQWRPLFEQLNASMADIWLSSLKPKAYEVIHNLNRTNYRCCSQPSLSLEDSLLFYSPNQCRLIVDRPFYLLSKNNFPARLKL